MPPLSESIPGFMPRVVATPNASNGTSAAAPTNAATPRPDLSASICSSLPACLNGSEVNYYTTEVSLLADMEMIPHVPHVKKRVDTMHGESVRLMF